MGDVSRYDRWFGGARGAAETARAKMHKTYGRKDGEAVWQATIAKRKHKAKTQRRGLFR